MTRRGYGWTVGGLLVVLVLAAFWPAFGAAAQGDEPNDEPGQKAVDHARALARSGRSPDRLVIVYDNAPDRAHPTRIRVRAQVGGKLVQADRSVGRDVIRVPNGDAEQVAQRVRGTAGVLDAYADQIVTIALTVDDPLVDQQWSLTRIDAPTAWDTAQGAGVAVAVLDCGIHASHPDLLGRVVLESNFTTAATTDDRCNHGTHVAGTIAALTNNAVGVAAVAPGARLVNGKVLDDKGEGFFSDLDRGIQWAADSGARVISMSLGADIPCPSGTQAAADYAWSRGAVLVAAAGNAARSSAGAPANCRNVIGVAATDAADARAGFSNSGPETDVAAPGVSILSTVNPDLNLGLLYRSLSGTSMAAPHAAGVLALIWSTPDGTDAAAVRDRLFATADRVAGTGPAWTYGRINAAAAVTGEVPPTPSVTGTPTPTSTRTPTITRTPTDTRTTTPSRTPTDTPTRTPSRTPTDTRTTTPSRTPTDTRTTTPSRTPTDTRTTTPSRTPTDTPTRTPSRTPTDTPTRTPSRTPTDTRTTTPSRTPTDTRTRTPSRTPTDTRTTTPSRTPTAMSSQTVTQTPDTPTDTPTPTLLTATATPTALGTPTATDTPEPLTSSPTASTTSTPTPSDTETATTGG